MIISRVKTKEGTEEITAYRPGEAPLPALAFGEIQRNHKIKKYATDYICLDTETSHIGEECGWIYQWAACLAGVYIYGRKPSEIIDLLERVRDYYRLDMDKRIIIYIHNASYDLQYLKNYLYEYDKQAHFLAIDAHSIIIADVLGFRIICSYKLTNMSLNVLAKNYAKNYRKAVGEIDYNIIRYQDDELTDSDWFYMFSDVASQADGIRGYLDAMGYTYAYQAPFTSTGFVRVECRKASTTDPKWRQEFEAGALDLKKYNLCRQTFMGGVCIASFKYSGETVRSDKLRHKDFTSSYPARQMMDYAPTGTGEWYGEVEEREELDFLLENYCCIFELHLKNVHIKKGITAPCIPASKCITLKGATRVNGKIVSASELSICICELDFKWICRQYTAGEMRVTNLLKFARGKMPDWLKKEVFKYFNGKCTLKHKDPLLYAKSKALLNSIYGMTATAIIRDQYEMDQDHILTEKKFEDPEEKEKENEKAIHKYYSSYNSFMPYQYAIYTTAFARDALYTMIEAVGYDNFLYCDTDSVFYIETPENVKNMQKYQKYCKDRAILSGAYVGSKYLGMPEDEPPLRAFRALHAKCYAMEELNEETGKYELNVVIAGIPKKATKWINGEPKEKTNAEELGSIDNLVDGFVFSHCGGTRCVYLETAPEIRDINGHKTELSSAAIIENIEKTISDNMWTVENGWILQLAQQTV